MFNIKCIARRIAVIVLVISVFALAGCSNGQKSTAAGNTNQKATYEKRSITDTAGNTVELKKEVRTIAIVPIPWTSVVYAVDGTEKRIVGMHPSAKQSYEKSILKKMAPALANVATSFVDNDFVINMEEAKKLNPDVMIVWDYQTKEIEQLKGLGIPAIALKYGTLDDLRKGIELIGNLLGKQEKASKLVNYHEETENYFKTKAEELKNFKKLKVLYIRDEQLKVAGKGAVNTAFIEMAGGVNVAKDTPGQWVNVTMEQVVAWNPEIIIMSNFSNFKPDDILGNKIKGQDWSKIDAVKNKRVYKAPMGTYRWDAPCAESPLMIKWMAKTIQPEFFKDIDIQKDIKNFYKEYLNYDLTQEEIDSILQKDINK
ncbi:MAG: Iron(III) dicitrate-binding protein [Peptococcaceae bacterium]|jgi:iron complex transport system substrate-binding protein|nr:Iron(III) dicitrate-binding protein [Peptococcaceae bacterium]